MHRPSSRRAAELRTRAATQLLAWVCLLACVSLAASRSARADSISAGDVLTIEEAAAHLRIETSDLEALAASRRLPGRRIGDEWRFSRAALDDWLAGTDSNASLPDGVAEIPTDTLGGIYGRGPDATAPTGEAGAPASGDAEAPASEDRTSEGSDDTPTVGFPPEGKTAAEIFLRRQTVLLKRGEFIIEPTVVYSNAQQRELVAGRIAGDDFQIDFYQASTVVDRIASGMLFVRLGLFDETEVYAGARYRGYHSSSTIDFETGAEILPPESDPRLGKGSASDVALGINRTLLRESRLVPDVILTAEGGIPISHASPSMMGKLWLVKSFDPIVVYGGVDYRYTWSRNYQNLNLLVPENRIRGTIGYSFSVNDSITLSTSLTGGWSSESTFDRLPEWTAEDGLTEVTLQAREAWSLRFGMTSRVSRKVYLEPSVTLGLSGAGNWVAVGLSVPWFVN